MESLTRDKKVICLSGGLDSTVLLFWIRSKFPESDLYTVSFNYGQRHARELDCAVQQSVKCGGVVCHKEIDISFLKNILTASALTNMDIPVPKASEDLGNAQSNTYVPNRNMILLSILVGYAESIGSSEVYYGAQAADNHSGYFDATSLFLDSINNVLNLNRKNRIQIVAPFISMDKDAIVKLGSELNVDFASTHTCYNGKEIACGKCVSCANRIQAFMNNGLRDPLRYDINIPW